MSPVKCQALQEVEGRHRAAMMALGRSTGYVRRMALLAAFSGLALLSIWSIGGKGGRTELLVANREEWMLLDEVPVANVQPGGPGEASTEGVAVDPAVMDERPEIKIANANVFDEAEAIHPPWDGPLTEVPSFALLFLRLPLLTAALEGSRVLPTAFRHNIS